MERTIETVSADQMTALPYAHFEPRPASRGWAGAAILAGGLGLVPLGGCFLIGVLGIVRPSAFNGPLNSPPMTTAATALMSILYLLAFVCFAGAAIMIFCATRSLLRIMRG
ncbi:hypothetical protein BH09PLA1_BH09PLA1_19710 [soil metagenome]